MAITSKIERDGTVTVTWNVQTDKLMAPQWEGAHYLPCEICGVLQVVGGNIVSCICNNCADVRKRVFVLDGCDVVEIVEFVQQLDQHDREAMLAMQPGEDINLGGGAVPLSMLRRVS
jgi:hypothetical protein